MTISQDGIRKTPSCSSVRVPLIRAAIALQSGDAAKALAALTATAPHELSNLQTVYLRGQAYLAAGNGTAAAAEFQKIIDRPGEFDMYMLGPLAHLGLGRAYARAGDTAKSTTAYQDFPTLWEDADPQIPILKEARAEYEKMKEPLTSRYRNPGASPGSTGSFQLISVTKVVTDECNPAQDTHNSKTCHRREACHY